MAEFDLVVRDGTVVTAGDTTKCDIGIKDGRIVALAEKLGSGAQEIDASGRLVLPGGVDAHCHMDQVQSPGIRMADDFESGTRSAACGGTTTVIPFAAQVKGAGLRAAVEDYHRRAEGMASVDYAFHMILTDPTPTVLDEELPDLVASGYTSFKIYMTYEDLKLNDREILKCLAVAKREGALTMIHAENSDCIAWLTEALEDAGLTAPKYHANARPPVVEREATHRALSLAELIDVPILIVHVSGGEAIEQIRWARGRGLKIHAETCPQYITLTAADLDLDGFEGAKLICSPPPRDHASHEAVWRGLSNGLFEVFSSDHAPFRYDDAEGKKAAGEHACFSCVPNGIPGLETRLAILFSEGVVKGRIDLNRFVSLTSTGPARLYGLYPRKGTIAVGADADLAIWDAEQRWIITNDKLHHAVDYTPYEGMEVQGRVITTILRGQVIWDEERFLGQPGMGRFLSRPRHAKMERVARLV